MHKKSNEIPKETYSGKNPFIKCSSIISKDIVLQEISLGIFLAYSLGILLQVPHKISFFKFLENSCKYSWKSFPDIASNASHENPQEIFRNFS